CRVSRPLPAITGQVRPRIVSTAPFGGVGAPLRSSSAEFAGLAYARRVLASASGRAAPSSAGVAKPENDRHMRQCRRNRITAVAAPNSASVLPDPDSALSLGQELFVAGPGADIATVEPSDLGSGSLTLLPARIASTGLPPGCGCSLVAAGLMAWIHGGRL